MIKITHIIPNVRFGGTEWQFVQLLAGLAGQEIENSVITLDSDGLLADKIRPHAKALVSVQRTCALDPRAIRRTRELLYAWRPHVMHTWLLPGMVYGGWAGRNLAIPFRVASYRGVGFSSKRRGLRDRCIVPVADRMFAGAFDRFVVNSTSVAAYLMERGIPRSVIAEIPNGIDWTLFESDLHPQTIRRNFSLPPDAWVIGFVGRMDKQKSLDTLLKAVKLMNNKKIWLFLVGEGGYRAKWMRLAENLGIASRCRWTGFLEARNNLYPAMDVFCLPSQFGEGCSNALLEAMGNGIAAIVSNAPGTGEILHYCGGGMQFVSGNAVSLAANLDVMLHAPDTAAMPTHEAMAQIRKRFSLDAMLKQYRAMYHNAMGQSS